MDVASTINSHEQTPLGHDVSVFDHCFFYLFRSPESAVFQIWKLYIQGLSFQIIYAKWHEGFK